MKIDDDHMYHGAALIQIAEDPQFTAINSFKLSTGVSRSAYRINDDIGVYLKYASKPTPAFREYGFTFQKQQLTELQELADATAHVFVALVCVQARQICCLRYADLVGMIAARKKAKGVPERQYVILATVEAGKRFRVYVNKPGAKGTMLEKALVIKRNDFPSAVFA